MNLNYDIIHNIILQMKSEKDIINTCSQNKHYNMACRIYKESIAKHLLKITDIDIEDIDTQKITYAKLYKSLSKIRKSALYLIINRNDTPSYIYTSFDEAKEAMMDKYGYYRYEHHKLPYIIKIQSGQEGVDLTADDIDALENIPLFIGADTYDWWHWDSENVKLYYNINNIIDEYIEANGEYDKNIYKKIIKIFLNDELNEYYSHDDDITKIIDDITENVDDKTVIIYYATTPNNINSFRISRLYFEGNESDDYHDDESD